MGLLVGNRLVAAASVVLNGWPNMPAWGILTRTVVKVLLCPLSLYTRQGGSGVYI